MSRRPFVCAYCHQNQFRTFVSSTRLQATPRTNPLSLLPEGAEPPPPYPYGPARWYKQQNKGLYGNAVIQFGNNVSEEFNTKTRRTWLPNVVDKHLYSEALDQKIRVKVHARVLRTIDKVGGLDEYLVGMKSARIKELGEQGWKLRWAVLQTSWGQERIKNDPELRKSMMIFEIEEIGKLEDAEPVERVNDVHIDEVKDAAAQPSATDIEERIQRRLDESSHMAEARPPSMWARLRSFFGR